MKLIVGLGNPGQRYTGTRHNIGFEVIAQLAERFSSGDPRIKFRADVVDADLLGERVKLLRPRTYMNNSGESVRSARDFFNLNYEQFVVVCDDFNLPAGKLRFRSCGSAGGQKGLSDVIRCLDTQDFPRLRVGVGPVPDFVDPSSFVLGRFRKEEADQMNEAVDRAVEGLVDWAHRGIDYCMNQYN